MLRLNRYHIIGFYIIGSLVFQLFNHKDLKEIPAKTSRNSSEYASEKNLFQSYEPKPERTSGTAHVHRKNYSDNFVYYGGINNAVSDSIPLDRTVPDTRHSECKNWKYPRYLPDASIIIVFHNEAWSTLLRTVYSVINRTPSKLLHEILLVDDFSNSEHLQVELEEYLTRFGNKVKLIRTKKREGLIRTKNLGASVARGQVIVFLDAHCEVNLNWLPPLLTPIYEDKTVMTVPIHDFIDPQNFEYRTEVPINQIYHLDFDWGLAMKFVRLTEKRIKSRKHESDPFPVPSHPGGLLAVNRTLFLSIGGYDPQLHIWGGENFELSFKIWMCGGGLLTVPCSRVGHVSRIYRPYALENVLTEGNRGPVLDVNLKRIMEVWFDKEYKANFYIRRPWAKYVDAGDISLQLALKQKLHCKSFQWYLDNVASDHEKKLPINLYWGELRNVKSQSCLDVLTADAAVGPVKMKPCNGINQLVRLNIKGQMALGMKCIEQDDERIKFIWCSNEVNGPWMYNNVHKLLYHKSFKKCLALHLPTYNLSLRPCKPNNTLHQWVFKKIYPWWYTQN